MNTLQPMKTASRLDSKRDVLPLSHSQKIIEKKCHLSLKNFCFLHTDPTSTATHHNKIMSAPGQRYGCYIGNIDRSVPLDALKQLFSQCGAIVECSLNGRDTDPFRYGFIDFASEADRDRALKFDGMEIAERRLKVGVSRGNVNRPLEGQGGYQPRQNMPPMSMAPPAGGDGASMGLLLQLVQSGAVNFASLNPDQQRQISAVMMQQQSPAGGMMGMGGPPMGGPQGHYGGMMGGNGGYGGHQMGGRGGYGMGGPRMGRGMQQSVNPPPSEETIMLRQAQRKTFFDVVRKEAERYIEKKKKSRKSGSDSDSGSSDDENEGDKKKARGEGSSA